MILLLLVLFGECKISIYSKFLGVEFESNGIIVDSEERGEWCDFIGVNFDSIPVNFDAIRVNVDVIEVKLD